MVAPYQPRGEVRGHKGLAQFLKYAIEKKAYDKMVIAFPTVDFPTKKKKK
jgi:hypothetical protein